MQRPHETQLRRWDRTELEAKAVKLGLYDTLEVDSVDHETLVLNIADTWRGGWVCNARVDS